MECCKKWGKLTDDAGLRALEHAAALGQRKEELTSRIDGAVAQAGEAERMERLLTAPADANEAALARSEMAADGPAAAGAAPDTPGQEREFVFAGVSVAPTRCTCPRAGGADDAAVGDAAEAACRASAPGP